MSSVTVTFVRGNTYVKNDYHVKDKDKQPMFSNGKAVMATAHGLVGELWVHGLMFEAIERMDGYMHMEGGKTYRNSAMYWNEHYGSYVINPWLGREVEAVKKNILFHPATQPSHLEGCVSLGFLNPQGRLEDSKYCLDVVWEQCGGRPGVKSGQIVMSLAVEGQMRAKSACSPWTYTG
ncbi:hypothetical protein ACVFYP_07050 [Roseomonas sp. F4]